MAKKVFAVYLSEREAKRLVSYLNKEYGLFATYPLTLRKSLPREKSFPQGWVVEYVEEVEEKEALRFAERSAYDFSEGYKQALREVKAKEV